MKRVVLEHRDGMMQILGVSEDPPIVTTAVPFVALGRQIPFASLVRVTRRMAVYREPLIPASYTFNEAQK